jgi:hypothetical protein
MADEERPMSAREAADHLGTTTGYLSNLRHFGKGPPWSNPVGKAVAYRRADLDAWRARATDR